MKKHYNCGKDNINFGSNKQGKKNPNFKHGKCLIKSFCIDCGKKLDELAYYHKTIRCRSCSAKRRFSNPEHTPSYIDGRTLLNNYCQKCGLKISYPTFKIGENTCNSCAKMNKNNGMWQGGISYEPYTIEFNKKLKEKIRNRDNHECQKCHIKEIILKGWQKKLSIHHIDYNKQNCNEENLITICHSCNSIVNANRDYWFAYFSYLIGYKHDKR